MNQFKNCPLVYVAYNRLDTEYQQSFRRLLEILEVNVDRLQRITQPTQFDKIILPDSSFAAGYTNEYCEMMERVRDFALKNRTPISNKKLYFYHGVRQMGEERLAEYFKSKGYAIITHEQRVDFDEELNLLINCESFASTLGSCAHNSVFLLDGTETIFIPREGLFGRDYQVPLDQLKSLNANYIDSTMSIFDKGNRYHCYIISEQLKRFFGDKWNGYEEEDFKIFLQYIKNSMTKEFDIDSREKQYYASTFPNFMAQLKRHKDLIASYDMPPRWEEFKPRLTYLTHIHIKGSWTDGLKFENQISNPLDQKLEILAIKVNFPNHKVYYSVYYNEEENWTEEVSINKWAGVIDKRKPIYGMRVRFDEAGAKEFNILYRMHKFDGTWTPWAKNGEAIYSHSQKLNAIQMKLEPVKSQSTEEIKEFPIDNKVIHWQRQDLHMLKDFNG